jgi:hypothetical protein
MNASQFGPFAAVIAIAAALTASFSLLLLKSIGKVARWTWLIDNTPPFVVTVAARALAVVLIALVFVLIDRNNYLAFILGALIFGILALIFIARFDYLRRVHIVGVPILQQNGGQAVDKKGNALFHNIVIGTEQDIRPEMRTVLADARKGNPGLSLTDFLAGIGIAGKTNNPESLWTKEYLAAVSNRMTMFLMGIVLCAVMALYVAASVVEASTQTPQ